MYKEFDAIIFDMDGTLVDSGRLHENAWTLTLAHYGIPLERPLMRSLSGVSTIKTIHMLIEHFSLSIDVNTQVINDFKESIIHKTLHQYVKPTILEKFALDNKGKRPMSIGTGAHTDEAKVILSTCGLLDLMDHVVGADQVENSKPSPDTFLLCAQLMNVAPERCIVFEDAKAGIEAAKAAGMFVVDVLDAFNIENDYFLS